MIPYYRSQSPIAVIWKISLSVMIALFLLLIPTLFYYSYTECNRNGVLLCSGSPESQSQSEGLGNKDKSKEGLEQQPIQKANNIVKEVKNEDQQQEQQPKHKKDDEEMYGYEGLDVTVQRFRPQNEGKKFGFSDKFAIKVDPISFKSKNPSLYKTYEEADIINKIQVGSPWDYANLTKNINFSQLAVDLGDSIPYQLIKFKKNINKSKNASKPIKHKVRKPIPILQQSPKTQTPQQFLRRLFPRTQDFKLELEFASKLNPSTFSNSSNSSSPFSPEPQTQTEQQNLQLEYYYYNLKHKLSTIKNQLPICIYAGGYRLFSKNRYKPFLQSVSRQNYTNFHLVYMDDYSPKNQIKNLIKYLQEYHPNLHPKITIIHTLQNNKAITNMYFWINKYCNINDIVLHVDGDDYFSGRLVMQVLNAVYQDSEVWFVYSRYMWQVSSGPVMYINGQSQPLSRPARSYKNSLQWDVSHLRTFRQALFSKIPLQNLLEYHLNMTTSLAYPHFTQYASDAFQIFNLLQLSGDAHYRHITDYLYIYSGEGSSDGQDRKKCYAYHEKMDDFKARMKWKLKELTSLEDPGVPEDGGQPHQMAFNIMAGHVYGLKRCLTDP